MSSISFPSGSHTHEYYPFSQGQLSLDETTLPNPHPPQHPFQINPLSPRTPRTSTISSSSYVPLSASLSQHTHTLSHVSVDEHQPHEQLVIHEDDLDSVGGQPAPVHVHRVGKEEIWREIVKSSNGRDKALVRGPCQLQYEAVKPFFAQKLIQYSLKLSTTFHQALNATAVLRRPRGQSIWETDILARVNATVAGLSLTRYA
jgi:hypothetical protein